MLHRGLPATVVPSPVHDGPTLPCTYNVPNSVCDNLLCAVCSITKATRQNPPKGKTHSLPHFLVLKTNDLSPSDRVNCDHYLSPIPGCVIHPSGWSSPRDGYIGGTIYKTITAADTISGKLLFEHEAADVNVKVQAYHSDMACSTLLKFVTTAKFLLSFSGVGTHHQNSIAEHAIRRVTSMACASMLHAALHWPHQKFITLWPFAMTYAIWVHNQLPAYGNGWTHEELWA
ncbi:LOW QUALITY PROTEIN: hypothetical protein ACHAW6_003145 [Cyclotella cf. meneghiniana]